MNAVKNTLFHRLALMVIAIVAGWSMTSCDDGDYYNHPLVGNWALVAPTNVDYNEYYFYPDGTGQYFVSDYWGQDYYNFAWDTAGPNLTVYFYNGDVWQFGWTVQGNSLYLYSGNDPVPYVYTYF